MLDDLIETAVAMDLVLGVVMVVNTLIKEENLLKKIMHISYNGVIAVYSFNCPFAHKLKNIERVYIEPKEEVEVEVEHEEVSKRMRGIELHDQCAKYLKKETEDFPFITNTLIRLRDNGVIVEATEYYNLDLSLAWEKPSDQDYISTRKDAILRTPTFTEIFDAKFGSLDYGFSKHIDECEFFLACEASAYTDPGEWHLTIHFPEHDYTIPRNVYNYQDISRLQQLYINRINVILDDKIHKPIPSEGRCRFCAYRSKDALGSGHCPFSIY